jgi:hypothetical protein
MQKKIQPGRASEARWNIAGNDTGLVFSLHQPNALCRLWLAQACKRSRRPFHPPAACSCAARKQRCRTTLRRACSPSPATARSLAPLSLNRRQASPPQNSNWNAVLCFDDQSVRYAALRAAAASRVGFGGAPLQSAHRKARQVRVDCRESNRQTPCKLVRSVRDLHAAQRRKRRGVLGSRTQWQSSASARGDVDRRTRLPVTSSLNNACAVLSRGACIVMGGIKRIARGGSGGGGEGGGEACI